jgi:hypothetical protein
LVTSTCHQSSPTLPPSSSSVLLSSLELSHTKVDEPYTRSRLGTASHFCKAAVLKFRTVRIGTALSLRIVTRVSLAFPSVRCTGYEPFDQATRPSMMRRGTRLGSPVALSQSFWSRRFREPGLCSAPILTDLYCTPGMSTGEHFIWSPLWTPYDYGPTP